MLFNAKHSFWGSRTVNPKGRELIKCIQAKNLLHVSTKMYLLSFKKLAISFGTISDHLHKSKVK